jgi:hypothetical protein
MTSITESIRTDPGRFFGRSVNFNLRWPRLIGTVSFGGYVFHDIVHTTREYHHGNLRAHLDADTGIPSYRFFESPILRMKDRFTSRNAS